MNGSRRLERTRSAEENNYCASADRLGDTVSLIDDFLEAYDQLSTLLRRTADPPDELVVISLLFLACEYQMEKATLECLRGRLTDSVQITRRAIELAAFSARIHRHPHLAAKWIDATRGEDEYRKYMEAFRGGKIFPTDDKLLTSLAERYDVASKQFHGSPQSMASRSQIDVGDDSIDLGFAHFEIRDDDPAEPARMFLWILDTHSVILRVFEEIFTKQLGEHVREWEVRRNGIEAKLASHKNKWASVVFPEPGPE
jgi:hypothetical protein